jgi:hypothetical protein
MLAGPRAARPWRPRPRRLASAWVLRESLGGASDRARVSLRQVNTSCWRSQCAAFGRSYVHAALEAGASGFAQRAPRRPALSRPCDSSRPARRSSRRRSPDRGVRTRPADRLATHRTGRAHGTRSGSPRPKRSRTFQHRDRRAPHRQSGHREDARQPDPLQARPPRPRPSRRARLRMRTRSTRRAPAAQHLTWLSTGHAPAGRHGSSTPSRSCIRGRTSSTAEHHAECWVGRRAGAQLEASHPGRA